MGSKYKLSDYNLLQEQENTEYKDDDKGDYRVQSTLTTQTSDRETKGELKSKSTGLRTGKVIDINRVEGAFGNGVFYSTMNDKITYGGDKKNDVQKVLLIGKRESGKYIEVVYTHNSQTGKHSFFIETDGKIEKNPFKIMGHIMAMGVTPKEFIQVIKKITTKIDTSELEAELQKINEAQLSRGALYRQRYYGRY
jgi:hypothetical protein